MTIKITNHANQTSIMTDALFVGSWVQGTINGKDTKIWAGDIQFIESA